jgi:hypothetical protein
VGELEHGRDRRLKISDKPRPRHLRGASIIEADEGREVGLDQSATWLR